MIVQTNIYREDHYEPIPMNAETIELIDRVKDKAMRDEDLNREELIGIIDIDPDSEECDYLGKAAWLQIFLLLII